MLSRRSLLTALASLAAAPLALVATGDDAGAQARPHGAPPAARREVRPPPKRGYTWVPGHWTWDARRGWVWNAGYFERNRVGFRLTGPRWVLRRGQWVYEPVRWVPHR